MPPGKPKDWVWDEYIVHPDYKTSKPPPEHSVQAGHAKVFCQACLRECTRIHKKADDQLIEVGSIQQGRSDAVIQNLLWNAEYQSSDCAWIQGCTDTMRNHLAHCQHQTDPVKQRAAAAKAALLRKRKHEPELYDNYSTGDPYYPDANTSRSSSHLQVYVVGPSGPAGQAYFVPPPDSALFATAGSPSGLPGPSRLLDTTSPLYPDYTSQPSPFFGPSCSASPPTASFFASGASLPPSRSASPFPPAKHLRATDIPPLLSRSSSLPSRPPRSRSASAAAAGSPFVERPWTGAQQSLFERCLIRMTASCGWALTWVHNPEVLVFMEELVHLGAIMPSRDTMTRRILPETLQVMRAGNLERIREEKDPLATIQFDGWTALNHHHYDAFMANISKLIYSVKVYDVSAHCKSGERLFGLLKEVAGIVENQWKVEIVATCSDAGPDASKARKLFLNFRKDVISIDCYAHQINLLVGTYFKISSTWYHKYSKLADEIITWIRSKTIMHYALKVKHGAMTGTAGLSVVHAVITRWTAHYLAYRRLLELHFALQALIKTDRSLPENQHCVIFGEASAKRKALSMIVVIEDPDFWKVIRRITSHLRPLAIAVNIAQASHICLDQILLIFALLWLRYNELLSQDDASVHLEMTKAIEARWSKADQDVFITALILNLFYKTRPFKALNCLTPGGIYALLCRLWRRFFLNNSGSTDSQPPRSLLQEVQQYLEGSGDFACLREVVANQWSTALKMGTSPDPLSAWKSCQHPHLPMRPLYRLARRILSVCANSASCERLFSTLGNILTKLRNCMGNMMLLSLAEMKLLIRDEHLRDGKLKERLKHHIDTDRRLAQKAVSMPLSAPSLLPIAPSPLSQAPLSHQVSLEPAMLPTTPVPCSVAVTSAAPTTAVSRALPGAAPTKMVAEAADVSGEDMPLTVHESTDELIHLAADMASEAAENELAAEYSRLFPTAYKIKLEDLIDFQVSFWSEACERVGDRGLNDEMELCELLESVNPVPSTAAGAGPHGQGADLSSQPELDGGAESILVS
ncbi:uncharacterized protein PHACADRAFT_207792 [Phanerochaete carnosa HHB-10118-sp]|uniref:HAT C-terminal dimerisation domain-containing protein n=1 Tax=Phanerochaete carnosa (strain HHB-10118-sp) TaxID=650164 RepID=K5V233_PHACS|nr:uncharacterized protein PHACADRAFT_207792 [Phanerochaete carnosa HHB-10118-sp]EKM56581.1 hypothetical protein PHACADRAFT_207792 [Phanerochaete carnosa HHB-10118-sp]